LSLLDISDAIAFFDSGKLTSDTYYLFCDEIEASLSTAFGGAAQGGTAAFEGFGIMRSFSLAFAYTLLARLQIGPQSAAHSKTGE
ncbi:MAG: hypothetical protein FWF03_02560, partial [Defluviitaleaceae bacterium]|nr:hypothetical protein [Defluviitaleaceae bacterium]